ncbi:GIY-YIG nuclease family protein [Candidatus Saccharibacteria bacterium]|nr:GIY-YIG nuclease family protein [Candidatus Saccharibacteria bacterium]NIW79928.1 GIY-YIG nuclease family protein [Calditrichia bacterium]
MKCFLYILYSRKLDRYYIGVSCNVEARLRAHNGASKGWTKRGRPWTLVYKKQFSDKKTAQQCERWIKKQKSKRFVQKLLTEEFEWGKYS